MVWYAVAILAVDRGAVKTATAVVPSRQGPLTWRIAAYIVLAWVKG